jgi:hypothetical protein
VIKARTSWVVAFRSKEDIFCHGCKGRCNLSFVTTFSSLNDLITTKAAFSCRLIVGNSRIDRNCPVFRAGTSTRLYGRIPRLSRHPSGLLSDSAVGRDMAGREEIPAPF